MKVNMWKMKLFLRVIEFRVENFQIYLSKKPKARPVGNFIKPNLLFKERT